jgi:hypothetical protein
MANQVTLTFGGDADQLVKAAKKASAATEDVAASVGKSSSEMGKGGKSSTDFLGKIGKLGAGIDGMTTALDSAGAAVQALSDIQNAGREKAARLARAQSDVEQAMLDGRQAAVDLEQATNDLSQAQTDGAQASLDFEQAEIDKKQAMADAAQAQRDYNSAVKEHGRNSAEALQASIDLDQAQQDLKQSTLDMDQAVNDVAQSETDAKQAVVDSAQAVRDGKDAQLDLNDAMREANPSGLQQWAEKVQMITPLLSGLMGVVGLVTAAQWAWNAAQLASPMTWVVLGIVALVAVIVLIATKTKWFQNAWAAAWGWIKKAASNTWDFIKKIPGWIGAAFAKVSRAITAPFRAAFNLVADAWNNTVGGLSWTVPGWVPFVGGNTISAPHLPHFHSGGTVPGTPGSEQLAVLQAGEKVSTRGGGDRTVIEIRGDGSALADGLVEILSRAVRARGGNAQLVLGGRNA